jgi:hypothetical protein
MHVLIGMIEAFTDNFVRGLAANPEKAEGWLARNAILVAWHPSSELSCVGQKLASVVYYLLVGCSNSCFG